MDADISDDAYESAILIRLMAVSWLAKNLAWRLSCFWNESTFLSVINCSLYRDLLKCGSGTVFG